MISIVKSNEEWRLVLERIGHYDFYHTYDYHHLAKGEGESLFMVVYEQQDQLIAIPFLKRSIVGAEYFDLTSVYGYAGPLSSNVSDCFDNKEFVQELNALLHAEKIVSVFSRLHPYIKFQDVILSNLGEIPTLGVVVNIDLLQPLDVQRAQYGKSTKNRTNTCRRKCTVKRAETTADIETFISIYYENMKRLSANPEYFFARKYFFDFLKCTDFKTDILLVIHNETQEIIAGSMFVKTKEFVQFHLSGSRTDFLKLAPSNLFLDEMRVLATEEGYTCFNLGGGLGGRKDSLFDFKASFSKDHRDFKVWKYIVNRQVYQELSRTTEPLENHAYFPSYRK
ncbi:MAG: hypothetical protein ACR2NK_13000 [Mariniblastus sp.]